MRIREAFDSVQANIRTFEPVYYHDEVTAKDDLRNGKIQGAVIFPPQYSRRVYEKDQPQIALLVDNSDNFIAATVEGELTDITASLNNPTVQPRLLQQTVLQLVELYPYIEYMKFLLPGSITLAMFVSVMIGGGMLYIDDKARGVHEGYLVTPIPASWFLAVGAGAIKAVMTGLVITLIRSLIAGVGAIFNLGAILGSPDDSADFAGSQYHDIPALVRESLVRAMFGILNTLLFFPSGSVYPIQAFPRWLQAIAKVDPFTFAVHGFKSLLLKETGLGAIAPDLMYMSIFAIVTFSIAVPLFKRTL